MGLRWRAVIPIAVAMVLGVLVYCTQWQSLGRRSTSWPQSTDLDQHLASWQQSTGVSQECATCSTRLRVMTKASAMMGTSVRTKVSAVAKASAKSTVDSPHLTPQGLVKNFFFVVLFFLLLLFFFLYCLRPKQTNKKILVSSHLTNLIFSTQF